MTEPHRRIRIIYGDHTITTRGQVNHAEPTKTDHTVHAQPQQANSIEFEFPLTPELLHVFTGRHTHHTRNRSMEPQDNNALQFQLLGFLLLSFAGAWLLQRFVTNNWAYTACVLAVIGIQVAYSWAVTRRYNPRTALTAVISEEIIRREQLLDAIAQDRSDDAERTRGQLFGETVGLRIALAHLRNWTPANSRQRIDDTLIRRHQRAAHHDGPSRENP